MKLSLIKQIFNVDKYIIDIYYILAISPSKLVIIGFYEVMKCYSETMCYNETGVSLGFLCVTCNTWKNYILDGLTDRHTDM